MILALCLLTGERNLQAAEPSQPDLQKLIADLDASDKAVRRDASYRLSQMQPPAKDAVTALVKALDDSDNQVWFNSITALARIGPDAHAAIPALVKELEKSGRSRGSGQIWYRAAFALGSIGPAAFPALKEAIEHDGPQVRSGAAKALSWAGPQAEAFIPTLVKKLGDTDADVREQSAEALGSVGVKAIEPVIETLASNDPKTRQAAALALEWLGELGKTAIPILSKSLASESDLATQASFIRALSRLHCDSPGFIAHLSSGIQDPSDLINQEAANALLLLEPPETTSVPPLVELLKDDNLEVQKRSAGLLGRIGPSASAAVPDLIRTRTTTNDKTLGSICQATLVQIGAPAVPALLRVISDARAGGPPATWARDCLQALGAETVPALVEILSYDTIEARKDALRLLREIGPGAQPSEAGLLRLSLSADPEERALALEALASIPAAPSKILPIAERALGENNLAVRRSGAFGLAEIGKAARPALPQLIQALEDSDEEVASHSARAIGTMGTAAELAFPALQERLRSAPVPVQIEIVRALGGMGEAATPILPDFIRLLAEGPPSLKGVVAESLGRLGRYARETLPSIRETLAHPNASTRLAALDAFLRLEQNPERSLPVLTNALTDVDGTVRHRALDSIEGLGRRGQPAEPQLFVLLEKPDDRTEALSALRGIRADNVGLLTGALANEAWAVRQFAADRLGQLGVQATNALPELQKLRIDDNESVKSAARSAVRNIQRAARERAQQE